MLKGDSIILRSLVISDLKFLKRIENDKNNWKFGGDRKKFSNYQLYNYIKNASVDISIAKQYRFVIELYSKPIGFIDLFNYTKESADVGLIVANEYRNKGYANEALMLICNYAFDNLNLLFLKCCIRNDNQISIKLFASCGFLLFKEEEDFCSFVKHKSDNLLH